MSVKLIPQRRGASEYQQCRHKGSCLCEDFVEKGVIYLSKEAGKYTIRKMLASLFLPLSLSFSAFIV